MSDKEEAAYDALLAARYASHDAQADRIAVLERVAKENWYLVEMMLRHLGGRFAIKLSDMYAHDITSSILIHHDVGRDERVYELQHPLCDCVAPEGMPHTDTCRSKYRIPLGLKP